MRKKHHTAVGIKEIGCKRVDWIHLAGNLENRQRNAISGLGLEGKIEIRRTVI
jgi:hypothetical protein